MKPCQFMLALSLFCGVFTTLTSTNGSCGFFLVLIEQEHGGRLFEDPEVHTADEEQTGAACHGTACSPVLHSVWYHHPGETGRAVSGPGTCRQTPEIPSKETVELLATFEASFFL